MSHKFALSIAKLLALCLVLQITPQAAGGAESRTLAGRNAEPPPRIALLIGNADYPQKPLASPVRDARSMAAQLENLGFYVIKRENTGAEELQQILAEFGDLLQATKGVGLFYYAGHGIQVEGVNYLLPIDIDLRKARQVQQYSLSLNQVLDQVGQARNQTNIIIIDACRDNPYPRHSGLAPLSYANTPGNTFIAFATSPGNVAIDGDENGLFTEHLLAHLDRRDLPIEQLFKQVRQGVMQETQGAQIPWEHSSLTGDFYFNPPDLAAVAAASMAVVPQAPGLANAENLPAAAAGDSRLLKIDTSQLRLAPAVSKTPARITQTPAPARKDIAVEIEHYLLVARIYMEQTDFTQASHYLDKAFALSHEASPEQIEVLAGLMDNYVKNR